MRKPLTAGVLAVAALWGCGAPAPAPGPVVAPPASATPGASPAANAGPVTPSGAASAPPSGTARYRCEHNIEFNVRFANDSAVIDAGTRGTETLLRDAGGATPHQTVYSSTRMRVEFGLGVSGREAILRYALPPLVAHCVRD